MQPPADAKRLPSTMITKRDYGIKIARRGYDARYASDNNLLYNSSFPLLSIVDFLQEGAEWEIQETGAYEHWNEFNGTTSQFWKHNVRVAHTLDYAPMVMNLDSKNTIGEYLSWDTKYIYYRRIFQSAGEYNSYISSGSKKPKLLVIAVNIDRDVEYPYLDDGLPIDWGSQYDYGFKHILTGNPNAASPMDLGINANIQSMMVVAVKIATSDKKDVKLYIPNGISVDKLSPFCFVQNNDGTWRQGGVSIQAPAGFRLTISGSGTGYYLLDGQTFANKCSLVLVRQPMIAPDKDKASYTINM